MKALKLLIVFILVPFVQSIYSDEIVLQNGLNGYSGCEDASIFDGQSETYSLGEWDTLIAEFYEC